MIFLYILFALYVLLRDSLGIVLTNSEIRL